MTVTYSYDLSTASYWPQLRVLFRWKGGIWKAVLYEIIAWSVLYTALSCIYRHALDDHRQKTFEKVVATCYKVDDLIPMSFMLAFYVSLVAGRWWTTITNIGFTDHVVLVVVNYIRGLDERSTLIRRSIVRYMCLVQVMMYRACSSNIRKHFPTSQSFVDAGYLLPNERDLVKEDVFWIPLNWALSLAKMARDEGLIASDRALQNIFSYCTSFHTNMLVLSVYNWIPVPLVYTQVVFLTVRVYFLCAVVGRQSIMNDPSVADIYVPFQTLLQIVFYLGWLKVAEAMINPFGEDDDDFDGVWWLSRNISKAFEILQEQSLTPPPLATGNDRRRVLENEISRYPH